MGRWIIIFSLILQTVPTLLFAQCHIPEDYTSTRPNPQVGPTKVKIGLLLQDIFKVYDSEGTFKADFFLRLVWSDPRLQFGDDAKQKDEGPCFTPLDKIWAPSFVIFNRADLKEQYEEWGQIDPDGTVTFYQRYYGTLTTPLYLKDFPMDENTFNILILSYFGLEDIQFESDGKSKRGDNFNVNNWKFGSSSAHLDERKSDFVERTLSLFRFSIHGQRIQNFYFWDVIFPVLLIVLMSWTVFWISPVHRVAQITLSATSFLTLIAFQIRQTDLIPTVSYLTRMDIFSFTANFVVFLALAESILTSVLASRGKEKLAHQVDLTSRFGFPLVFIVASLVIFFGPIT